MATPGPKPRPKPPKAAPHTPDLELISLTQELCEKNLAYLLNLIHPHRAKWYNIGLQLNVPVGTLESIKIQTGDVVDHLRDVLREWLKQESKPTWKGLVNSLRSLSVGEPQLASWVEAKYCSTAQKHSASITATVVPKQDLVVASPRANSLMPLAEDPERASQENGVALFDTPSHVAEAQTEQDQLHSKFESLIRSTWEVLKQEDVSVSQLCHTISILPIIIKEDHKKFLLENLPLLCNARNLDEALCLLNVYMDYLNYSLLEHIITKHGNTALQQMMDEYVVEIRSFRRRTPLSVFCQIQPTQYKEVPPGFRSLVLKHGKSTPTSTLEDLEQFRQKFARHYSLGEITLILASIELGSVVITWLMPSTTVEEVKREIRNQKVTFFKENEIVNLTLDGTTLYAEERCYGDFHSKSKAPKTLYEAFEVALDHLYVLSHHGKITKKKGMREMTAQLRDRKVQIIVLGRHNVGKSTLINALLKDRLLPTHRRNESAVMVLIRHSEGAHLPQLRSSSDKIVAVGKEKICQYIRETNKSVREKKEKGEPFLLESNLPLLATIPGHATYLVDIPGFGESESQQLTTIAEGALRGGAAYVFVMSYLQLKDQSDISLMDAVKYLDTAMVDDGRLVVAVTHYDQYYSNGSMEEEMGTAEVITYTQDHLQEAGYSLAREQIVPMSGEWALEARQLKADPNNKSLLSKARRHLEDYKDACAHGEDLDIHHEVEMISAAEVADELEVASNIGKLESRIQQLTRTCDDVLSSSAKSKISSHLYLALEELKAKIKATKKSIVEGTRRKQHFVKYQGKIQERKHELETTTERNKDSEVYVKLLMKFQQESKGHCEKAKERIDKEFAKFYDSCWEKYRKGEKDRHATYTNETFNKDLDDFAKDLNLTIKELVEKASFDGTQDVFVYYTFRHLPNAFGDMKSLLYKLPGADDIGSMTHSPEIGPRRQTISDILDRNILVLEELVQHVKIPDVIEWTWWERIKVALRILIGTEKPGDPDGAFQAFRGEGPDPRRIPISAFMKQQKSQNELSELNFIIRHKEDMEDVFVDLKIKLQNRCDEYFISCRGLLSEVVENFFEQYTSWVRTGLGDFQRAYGDFLSKQNEAVQKLDEDQRQLEIEEYDLRYYMIFLKDLYKEWFLSPSTPDTTSFSSVDLPPPSPPESSPASSPPPFSPFSPTPFSPSSFSDPPTILSTTEMPGETD